MADVTVKLRGGVPVGATVAALRQIPGVVSLERLFPEETDPELSGLAVMRVDRETVRRVVALAKGLPGVEFVEVAPERRLVP